MATLFLHPSSPEILRAAQDLPGGPRAESGEGRAWVYDATQWWDGHWMHCFWHPFHPEKKRRLVVWIPAADEWTYVQETLKPRSRMRAKGA